MLDSSVWMSSAFSYCWLVPITRVVYKGATNVWHLNSNSQVSGTWHLHYGVDTWVGEQRGEGIKLPWNRNWQKPTIHALRWMGLERLFPPPPFLPLNKGDVCMGPLWLCEWLSLDWLLCFEHTIQSIFGLYKKIWKVCLVYVLGAALNHILLKWEKWPNKGCLL